MSEPSQTPESTAPVPPPTAPTPPVNTLKLDVVMPAPMERPRPGPPRPGDRGPRKPIPQRGDKPAPEGQPQGQNQGQGRNEGQGRQEGRGPGRGDGPPRGRQEGQAPQKIDFSTAMRPSKRDLDADLDSEMSAALAGFDVKGTVVEAEVVKTKPTPGIQPKKRGVIVGIHGKDVFVEVPGGRSQGVLPIMQFEGKPPQVGDFVDVDIEGYDPANGLVKLTMNGATTTIVDWSSIARGMIVEAKVTGVNKTGTGLQIEVNGIKGFMPISQIDLYRVEKPEDFINQKLKCEVVELNPEERNLIVSRKSLLERERQQKAEQFWLTLEEGQVKVGTVKSIKPFGVFVDLDGAADGLIPIGELSWSRVGDPTEVVQLGQKVEVMVSRLDRETRKIGLSLRQMGRSPWDDFADTSKPGARLVGKVTRIEDFGAFVELAPGIEGLVHVSELSTMRIRRVRDAVSEGQEVTVQVMSLDPKARRISLSLKALQAEAEAADASKEMEEKAADLKAAEERLAQRQADPNTKLRGGIGSGGPLFSLGGE
ncbi:MAG: 30S ribosomal protein S1 [Fimbriiglobus sp.]